jgi:hypothetical protein
VKRKNLLTCILVLAAAALAYAGLAPLQAQQKKAATTAAAKQKAAAKPAQKITVMNPAITSKMANRTPISPRLETLDGKTLYLVDISWGGPEAAYSVYEEMKDWFAQNKPSVKIVIKRKAGMYIQDDPALWREIKQNGNAALVGISG